MTYKEIALDSRKRVLDLVYKAQTSHIGSLFSCADIMAVLFEKIDLNKDVFVLSAGWKAALLYYHLWRKGRITEEELNSYCQPGSKWIGLAEPIHPDIPLAGGSMGLGLPGAVGLALAKKLKKEDGNVYVLMSDGEMLIGTTWESALIGSHHNLNNLVVFIDNNKLQAMGEINKILDIESLLNKWNAFGWRTQRVDGHSYGNLETILSDIQEYQETKPKIVICNTIKGKGVPKWEGDNLWHYAQIKEDDYKYALSCLN